MGNGQVKDFTDLRVWQSAKGLALEVYGLSKDFPKDERFGLTDQLRRAANSVCANISEGFSRFHSKDKIRFYYQARGSVSECKSHLLIAAGLGYIGIERTQLLTKQFEDVKMMLNGLISSLNKLNGKR